ncbi:MAG: transposase [Gammaproteobacteria bacterium]|nr:transposase [Gammaproteobacteria bacterium]
MARMPRIVMPGYPHHVTQRGNRRQQTFFREADYRYYIELVSEYSQQANTEICAYCLMPNHVHLVMVPEREDGLRTVLGEAHRRYTRRINSRRKWCGHLWQERFHSFPMDEDHLLATVRYVERNPLAARLCDSPQQWQWSSARAHIRGLDDGLVQVAPMLERVADWQTYLSNDIEPQTAESIKRHARTGRPLGTPEFVRKLESITGKTLAPKRPGRKPSP